MSQIGILCGFLLILIGLYGALSNRNILRLIVAFSVANTGVNLVIVSIGYMTGRTAPILNEVITAEKAASVMIDPLPQALVLTTIVIGLGVTALMLAYAYKLYKSKGTLDISKCKELKW